MDINLNLPTLPTSDQKNALDGANAPSTSNVFATANDLALKVPYTGANADVNLGEFGIQLGNLEFDTTPTNVPTGVGSMVWNDSDGTLDLKLKGGNVTLQIGQEQLVRVVNKTATNISLLEANYQAVRVTGAQGQRLKVDLAIATTDLLSAETIGLVTETIANNQEGFVTISGLVRGINTTGSLQGETWADGDVLYLSGTTAGNITNVKPISPIHLIVIGYVVYSHITQGTIFVKVDNGYELDELHDVLLSSRTDKDILAYESSTTLWKNKSASTLGIAELASPTFTGTVTSPAIILSSETANTIASFDASKNIKSLALATYPSLTELSYVKGVTSAIQTQLDSKSALGFSLQGFWSSTNPADATTYYASSGASNLALQISRTNSPAIAIPRDCVLKSVSVNIVQGAASSETVTYNIDVNSVQTLIATNNSTATIITVSNYAMSVSCLQGQLLYLQIVTPAWVTNPTNMRGAFTCYFE
jgi:hypothetical protein